MVKIQNFVNVNTDSFIVHAKTNDIYKDIPKDIETRFDTSDFEIDLCLKKKIKKVIVLMKGGLGGQIMKEFVWFFKFVWICAKTYSYLKQNDEDKKVKV